MEKQKTQCYHLFQFIAKEFMNSEPFGLDLKVTLRLDANNLVDIARLFDGICIRIIDPIPGTPTENPNEYRTYIVGRMHGKEIMEALISVDAFRCNEELKEIMNNWYSLG